MAATEESKPKKSKLPLVAGAVLALALGGGGFYAVYSGLIGGGDGAGGGGHGGEAHGGGDSHAAEAEVAPMPQVSFVPIQPVLVSLSQIDPPAQLRFEGNLEVVPAYAADVQAMMPRIMDVMNTYLRAVEIQDLRDPAALLRIRAQMLRRVQVVSGEGRVQDLLVTTFLIN